MGPQHPGGPTVALGEHPEQDVLGPEIAVATPLGLLPSEVENPMGLLGEPLEHLAPSAPGPAAGVLACGAAYGTVAPSSATSLSPSSSGSIPSASSSDPAAPR